jgi:hypothetical protein
VLPKFQICADVLPKIQICVDVLSKIQICVDVLPKIQICVGVLKKTNLYGSTAKNQTGDHMPKFDKFETLTQNMSKSCDTFIS